MASSTTRSAASSPRTVLILAACSVLLACAGSLWSRAGTQARADGDAPRATDPRVIVTQFAAAPDIVHPVNLTFDSRGRLLVIESHTHFRPMNYQGPKHDRVRMLEDTDGDGKADRFTTFFEGTQATMDIEAHPDGSIYLATRNEVLRLRDTNDDGVADAQERVVFLDTKGNYPHNGLSGLVFDARGDLYFGMGENLGASYRLVGADGSSVSGEGEGGNIFWCTADGKKLRRVATGFWNPFGITIDIYGRMFAVDNDPDATPPCRLLQVVAGGDYGYEFRYGRSGRHPFQAWNGQLLGTLPMAAGTGEAPCEVLSYESDGLPDEYRGQLLVTSWADHRVERYVLRDRGASVQTETETLVQGGKDFRPVGLAVAPDGSLFVSDWVLSNYELHGRGAIWHISQRETKPLTRPTDSRRGFLSMHRPLREASARKLAAGSAADRQFLREQLDQPDVRRRTAALTALLAAGDSGFDLAKVANHDPDLWVRAMAVRGLVERGADVSPFLKTGKPAMVRREAVAGLKGSDAKGILVQLLEEQDPFLFQAAVHKLAESPDVLAAIDVQGLKKSRQRAGVLLALRASGRGDAARLAKGFLQDPSAEVRLLAARWVADEKLADCRPELLEAMKDPQLSVPMYRAYASALARIDGQDVNENKMAEYFFARLTDAKSTPDQKATALRLLPATHKPLTIDLLRKLLEEADQSLQLECIRVLNEHPDPRRQALLLAIAQDARKPEPVRAEAMVGLSARSPEIADALLALANNGTPVLREEGLRALTGVRLSGEQEAAVRSITSQRPALQDLASRALGQSFTMGRPRPEEVDGWLKKLEGPADADAGRRVFFHPRLAGCSRCHRLDGRGQDIGPDLSSAGRMERRQILEAILQPATKVAPHYQAWTLATHDGRTLTGLLVRTYLDEYTYADSKGELFKLTTRDIAESRPARQSLMPEGMTDLLTEQEIRDLLAFLCSRR